MTAVFWLIDTILQLYIYAIFAMVILSWLYVFNVVNPRNQFVAGLDNFLREITEPILRPIRRILPNLGAVDIAPIVLFLGIMFAQIFIRSSIAPLFGVLRY